MSTVRPVGLADYLRRFEHQGGIIVSEERRFLYMKPPRTGGTSILREVLEPLVPGIIHHKDHPQAFSRWMSRLTDELLDEYFIFSFVRNPWDRFVSISFYFQLSIDQLAREFTRFQRKPAIRSHSLPLHGYSHCHDGVFTDFVGRFERLQSDFDHVCKRIGLKRTLLPHASRTIHEHYSNYYTNTTKQIVARLFAQDIEDFGYRFDDQRSARGKT